MHALDRAARLSESAVTRGRRLLRVAELATAAGRADLAREHLAQARPLLDDAHDRLRLEAAAETTDESMEGGAARVDAPSTSQRRACGEVTWTSPCASS